MVKASMSVGASAAVVVGGHRARADVHRLNHLPHRRLGAGHPGFNRRVQERGGWHRVNGCGLFGVGGGNLGLLPEERTGRTGCRRGQRCQRFQGPPARPAGDRVPSEVIEVAP